MDNKFKLNNLILKSAYALIIVLIIAVIFLLILKYEVEGEQNMPFNLSGIIVISSAEGYQEKESKEYKWDTEIYQNNDIYLNIEKNKNYKDKEFIKSIKIENIQIEKEPLVGNIEFYRTSEEEKLFNYKTEYVINDNIEYMGNTQTNLKDLKISNQGGTIILRAINKTGERLTSNDEEFKHNGTLLEKIGISLEKIKSKISFDIVINLESEISFRAKVELELPAGNLIKEGTSSTEITDTQKIIFKREQ